MSHFVEDLSDANLLALLIGRAHARPLLEAAQGSLQRVLNEPMSVHAKRPQAEATLRAARELVRRALAEANRKGNVLDSPANVRDLLRLSFAALEYEQFLVIFLDSQNHELCMEVMFRGTLNQTSVYPREIARRALAVNAAGVICAHNHPSGVAQPSVADKQLTTTLQTALSLVDVRLLDHFIVAGNDVMSFAERGLL